MTTDPGVRLDLLRPRGIPTTDVIDPQGRQMMSFTDEQDLQAVSEQLNHGLSERDAQ